MFGYDNMINNLNREKRRIEDMIQNYQSQPTPVNNFINTGQTSTKDLIEWRILNENEEVDNLYVSNKTLFINDNMMVLKGTDGSLEKWKVKKVYPIDKKDEKISQLEEEIKNLKEMINNEHTKFDEPVVKCNKSNGNANGNAESKSKTTSKSISK